MNLTRIKRPTSECGKPVIKIVTTTECTDSIGEDYYGTGDVIDGSEGVSPFPFMKITNLRGFIKRAPREIVRQVSQNGRTQKASSSKPYILEGGNAFPEWKMNELEEMFHAKNIYLDGYEVIFKGGSMFQQFGTGCPAYYKLGITIEEANRHQIYGCDNECAPNCYYFMIPARIVTQSFFNEAGVKVAGTYAQLLEWYRAQTNVTEVTDIQEEINVSCEYFRAFKVLGTGYVPSFLFFDSPSQSNKVFGMNLDCNQPDYSKLCGGIDNTACGAVAIVEVETYEVLCGDVEIESIEAFQIGEICGIVPFPSWIQHTGATNLTGSGNTRTMNISVFNSSFVYTPGSGTEITRTISSSEECHLPTGIPYTESIDEVKVNDVVVINWSTYNSGGFHLMVFDPCIEIGDVVKITYGEGTSYPILSEETIAMISGTGCTPLSPAYIGNAQNPDIPVGATLVINPNGTVQYYGEPTFADASGSVIEITNIIYNV